jgi:flagellar hook-associated protein 1 FlgK
MLVRTATGGQPLNLTSGSMAGTIEVRDGLLAQTRAAVNASAAELISAVNQAHRAGFSLTGSTGADFFTGTTAADLAVNQALVDNPALLQASGVAGEKGNNEVVLALAQLNTQARTALGGQTFSQHFAKTVSALGQGLANANAQQEDQAVILDMISQQRNSVSGVSLDEEMTDLMKFQKAYQASAKLVSTIDEMLDVVLNMKR